MEPKIVRENLQDLNEASSGLMDIFDRIKVSQRFDKDKIAMAKMMVNSAKCLVLGNLDIPRKITTEELAKITALVQEIAAGRRMKLYLELSPDHTEIIDVVSKKRFKLT